MRQINLGVSKVVHKHVELLNMQLKIQICCMYSGVLGLGVCLPCIEQCLDRTAAIQENTKDKNDLQKLQSFKIFSVYNSRLVQ